MITGPELSTNLAVLRRMHRGRVDKLFQRARQLNLIPTSSRGTFATPLTVEDTVAAIILVSIDATVAEAANRVPAWLSMTDASGVTFADALAAVLRDFASHTAELRINRHWPSATLIDDSGKVTVYGGFASDSAAAKSGYRVSPVWDDAAFTGASLSAIATEVLRPVTTMRWSGMLSASNPAKLKFASN